MRQRLIHSRADFLMNSLFEVFGVDDRPSLAHAVRSPIWSDHFYFGFARVYPVKLKRGPVNSTREFTHESNLYVLMIVCFHCSDAVYDIVNEISPKHLMFNLKVVGNYTNTVRFILMTNAQRIIHLPLTKQKKNYTRLNVLFVYNGYA